MRLRRIAALSAAVAVALSAAPCNAFTLHRAVTLHAAAVDFYAGHLVLDGQGGSSLDDGVLSIVADRIVVDLSGDRCVAAGGVRIADAHTGRTLATGDALGVDLNDDKGRLVIVQPAPASFDVHGAAIEPAAAAPSAAGEEPLALVDLEGELPFARAQAATAHLGADVRLRSAKVIVPGGKDVFIPSYVYTFSSDVGYSQSNVSGSSEDIPIYFGSTRDSVSGAHFTYNSVTKVGVGLDHRIVDGEKAYDLFSVSPINGPYRNAAFNWYEQINGHASQSLSATSAALAGSAWNYAATDSLHRSYLDLNASSSLGFNGESLTWLGAYEPLGSGWAHIFDYHVLSSYGRSQSYAPGAVPLYATTLEAIVQAPALALDTRSSLSLQADWRRIFDDQPHRQFSADYTATLAHAWNHFLTTQLSDEENPVVDVFPSFDFGSRTYVSRQTLSASYANGEPFSLSLGVTHQAGASVPAGISVQPWFARADVRFRVSSSLAFDISRSYGFGYNGQRFGGIGFQIFP